MGGQSCQIRGDQPFQTVQGKSVHDGLGVRTMGQPRHVADLVYRYPKKLRWIQGLRRVECNPTLKIRPIRELRSCHDELWSRLKKVALSIQNLNRTILSIVFVPLEVENTGPGIHGESKLLGQGRVRGSHS